MLSLIIDGPDKTFKTTTLRKLKEEIKLQKHQDIAVYKATSFSEMFIEQSKNDKSELFLNRLLHSTLTELDMQQQIKFDVIYDRHYPSEFVYSQYYNRPTDMKVLRAVDEKFKAMGGKIILLRRKDYSGWSDDLDTSIDLQKIDALYEQFIEWSINDVHCVFVDEEKYQNNAKARAQTIIDKIWT